MITLLTTPIDERTTPAELERVRRNLVDAIRELQIGAFAQATTIKNVELADGVPTPVAHKLGLPAFVVLSPPRGASTSGRITEVRGTHNPAHYVVLQADGWGATITVDLKAVPL